MAKAVYTLDTACADDPRRLEYEKLTGKKPAEGTRVYREDGSWQSFRLWHMEMRHLFAGDVLPFGWVAQFVGVTRAAVHKRVKTGQLTVFTFGMEEFVKGVLGGTRRRMRQEFKYALLTECHFWRSKLLDEAWEAMTARERRRQAEWEKLQERSRRWFG